MTLSYRYVGTALAAILCSTLGGAPTPAPTSRRRRPCGSGSARPRRSSATRTASRTSSPPPKRMSCSCRASCTRATGCSRWTSCAARPRARSRSCWVHRRCRVTSSCAPSACGAPPSGRWRSLARDARGTQGVCRRRQRLCQRHPLPPEYAALEVTRFRPWTEVDSVFVFKLLTFQLSFESSESTDAHAALYQAAGASAGLRRHRAVPRGHQPVRSVRALATIPDAQQRPPSAAAPPRPRSIPGSSTSHARTRAPTSATSSTRRRSRPARSGRTATAIAAATSSWSPAASASPARRSSPTIRTSRSPRRRSSINIQLHAPAAGIEAIGATLPGVALHRARQQRARHLDAHDEPARRHRRVPGANRQPIPRRRAASAPCTRARASTWSPCRRRFAPMSPGDGINDNLNVVPPGRRRAAGGADRPAPQPGSDRAARSPPTALPSACSTPDSAPRAKSMRSADFTRARNQASS